MLMTTGAIGCAKLQLNHYLQQTNTHVFTDQMPFLSLSCQHQSTDGKCFNIFKELFRIIILSTVINQSEICLSFL